MGEHAHVTTVRVLTAIAVTGRSKAHDEIAHVLSTELKRPDIKHVRHVSVKGEAEFVQALFTQVALDNEADVIILVGGTGFGPGDNIIEGLNGVFERRIEGFAHAYRTLLLNIDGADHTTETGTRRAVRSMLARATAGVYNECIVFAFSGDPHEVKAALDKLVIPALPEAVSRATGKSRS